MTDRFIRFDKRMPTPDDVARILRNYFDAAGKLERHGDRWLISLPGQSSSTFAGIEGAYTFTPPRDERWIEVIDGRKSLDVLTRQQDDFTCALADGLAQALARFYGGALEDS